MQGSSPFCERPPGSVPCALAAAGSIRDRYLPANILLKFEKIIEIDVILMALSTKNFKISNLVRFCIKYDGRLQRGCANWSGAMLIWEGASYGTGTCFDNLKF